MGASQEKRKRQQGNPNVFGRNREAQEAALKAKKTRRTTIIIVAVVLVCFLAALFINSKYIRRTGTALEIGDNKITVAEFNYFYYNAYYEYYNTVYNYYGDYASSMLPSTSEPLSNQVRDESTGETWADYFAATAKQNLISYYSMYDAANAAGYELSEDGKALLADELSSLEKNAKDAGFDSADKYMSSYYGKGMTASAFGKCAEVMLTASEYETYYRDSFEYTPEEIADKRDSEDGMYDQFDYRYFYVSAVTVDESQYENDAPGLEAAKAAALADAKTMADNYCADIESEEDFLAAAADYDPMNLTEESASHYSYLGKDLSAVFADWLKDDTRKNGDVSVIDGTSGYYIIYFIGRDANDYNTRDIRLIRISPETVSEEDYANDTDGYNAAVAAALDAAETKANELHKAWKDAGGTEELFAQYADENSSATAKDGLFESISKNALGPQVSDWCYDYARKNGDTTVICSDSDNCCYILWFSGEGDVYSDYLAEEDLRNSDYDEWNKALTESYAAEEKLLYSLTK